ncbi:Serpentine receptor class gamma [Caenorhabditis elegans]|uniref:Serpentine receptor class gamma n=1 Tax=Caenorhabditis elegans TaxID=6239 RepID=Q22642_CAEEL|nr:Serpentine receptor class gamma [Caenorhabditis elegans]CAA97334.2 Serpentine receptor class gamma [Caenorhabditis elegans]|eukprot:NP_505716.2 Serpentine receptor class gamma [Caenorhabditis elegans]
MLTPLFFLPAAYGVASSYLYTLIILMMIRRWNEYNTAFFKLFIIEYVFNMVTFANSFVTLRAPQNTCNNCTFAFLFERNSSTEEDNFPLQVFFTIHYCMAFIQYFMTFLSSLNRLTMVFFVDSYEKIWRPSLPFLIMIVIIFPMIMTWPIATNNAYFIYSPTLGGFATKTVANSTEVLNSLVTFMIVFTLFTATANIVSIIRLTLLPTRISGAERNLFTVSFVSFIIQLLALGDTLILRAAPSEGMSVGAQTAKALMPFVSDILTFNHPWTIMYFSTKVRTSMATDHFPSLRSRAVMVTSSVY